MTRSSTRTGPRLRAALGAASVAVVAVGSAGCTGSPEEPEPDDAPRTSVSPGSPAPDDIGGMGVPQLAAADSPRRPGPVRFRVRISPEGCFLGRPAGAREALLVVWPEGTRIGDRGDELVLPTGPTVTDGTLLPADGAVVPVRSLPAYAEDGYWAMAVGFCTPGAREVLVLTGVPAR